MNEVRKVLWIMLFFNFFVVVGKIVVGFMSGVLVLISDGFYFLLDGLINVVGFISLYWVHKLVDDDYHYGYEKIEVMVVMGIGIGLLIIVWELLIYFI